MKMKSESTDSAKDKLTSMSLDFKNTESDSEDEIQMRFPPYNNCRNAGSKDCCGCLPVPFERAAPHSWIRPCFDSDILESQFKINSFKPFTKRYRYALVYIMFVSTAWLIYLTCQPDADVIKYEYLIFTQQFLVAAWFLFLTFRNIYNVRSTSIAGAAAVHLVLTSLFFTFSGGTSTVSHFTMMCYVILVIYTIFPLPPFISLIICVLFSTSFEVIVLLVQRKITTFGFGFIIRILCHICIHVIGFHILVMTHVRVRGTFMKVGQRLLVRQQLEMEKQLKEKMIHSVMPPKVAAWLLSTESGENSSIQRNVNHPDFGSLFRPFNMSRMDNVSILFADIVGFTKMSSNKTAEEIVDILNDLFERFDDLCMENGCEKISTLGDCYYCVSGCPEPRSDHAKCCVEMGLGMIDAIQEFDEERNEDVNMRVGVHTGTVLCGIVGTRRFKFDVWSNDVTFANKLESTGIPGRVHISEQTAEFLHGLYKLEERHVVEGLKTFLIETRIRDVVKELIPLRTPVKFHENDDVRERVNSYNTPHKRPHYLSLITENRLKFTSLPNVLTSNNANPDVEIKKDSNKWSSFTRLKKNVTNYNSASEVEHSLSNRNPNNMVPRTSASSLCKLEVPKSRKNPEELSLSPSVNSRKDSGIRSTSRRSSIQQQIYLMNGGAQGELSTHRVSGYYTSSQSTLAPLESDCENVLKGNDSENIGSCYLRSRKKSDLQLVRCMNDVFQNSYVVEVPLHPVTLFFKDEKTEKEYRAKAYNIYEDVGDNPVTLSTTRFNTYFDILISAFVFICTTISLYVLYIPSAYFVIVSVSALLIEIIGLFLCLLLVRKANSNRIKDSTKRLDRYIVNLFSKWYAWHIFGGILVSLPIIVILTNFTCHSIDFVDVTAVKNYTFDFLNKEENRKLIWNVELRDHYYTFLIIIALAHFCNYTQLNCYMKSSIALVTGIIYLVVISNESYQYHNKNYIAAVFVSQFLRRNLFDSPVENATFQEMELCCREFREIMTNLSDGFDAFRYHNLGSEFLHLFYSKHESLNKYYVTDEGYEFLLNLNKSTAVAFSEGDWISNVLHDISNQVLNYNSYETILNIVIILVLVIMLNREFEISYRMSYYCNAESSKDKMRVQNMKDQADWLLENIIPKYVISELKNRAKYCENHSNVGIIFASIVNFNKLYDETYSGGKEYLRVLNELISDFDELLMREDEFRNVDKIKTIGSTFMGASGLNPEMRKRSLSEHEHIYELMEFALAMYKVVDQFNSDLLGFNLILRVGLNIGEVTAGVIGTSKLFYDIWGDAVNVASRMDSTGVDGRIQVPYSTLGILSPRYNFEPRGSVYVKGKDTFATLNCLTSILQDTREIRNNPLESQYIKIFLTTAGPGGPLSVISVSF